MNKKIRGLAALLVGTGIVLSSLTATATTPIQIKSVTLYKKYPTFIIVKVTSANTTSRQVQLKGYLNALDKNGYTTYQPPSFNEINMYGVNNLCTGDTVNGTWPSKRSYTATWCFAVPKGKTIKSVYISAKWLGSPMISQAVNIKN